LTLSRIFDINIAMMDTRTKRSIKIDSDLNFNPIFLNSSGFMIWQKRHNRFIVFGADPIAQDIFSKVNASSQ